MDFKLKKTCIKHVGKMKRKGKGKEEEKLANYNSTRRPMATNA
jgi:hypothetical protein